MLAGQFIHIGAVQAQLAPPDAQAVDNAGPCSLVHPSFAVVSAPVVEHTHDRAVGNAALGRIAGVHFQHGLGFDVAQALHVDESGVEEVARRRRDHGQRVAATRRGQLVVGQVVGQAVQPLVGQALAEKFALARGRRKAALRKGRIGHGQ